MISSRMDAYDDLEYQEFLRDLDDARERELHALARLDRADDFRPAPGWLSWPEISPAVRGQMVSPAGAGAGRGQQPGPTLVVREYRAGRALCMCGCGRPAPLAQTTRRSTGWVKGRPLRYIHGHSSRRWSNWREMYRADVETGCWLWLANRNEKGYGRYEVVSRTVQAHRFVYEQLVGPIPDGLQLDHLCRNPACVNPEHLEPVTPAENTRRGVNVKLTLEDAREIYRRRESGESGTSLAREFGVSTSSVNEIGRTTWREIAPDSSNACREARACSTPDPCLEEEGRGSGESSTCGDASAVSQRTAGVSPSSPTPVGNSMPRPGAESDPKDEAA